MKHVMLLASSLIIFNNLPAQQCNCLAELKFLENKIEHNLPAYQDQVVSKKRYGAYARHKNECNTIASQLTDDRECTYLIAKYISFFRDEHLRVNFKNGYFPFSSLDDTLKTRAFFQKESVYKIPPADKDAHDPVCGYWQSKDKTYLVKTIKHKTLLMDYIAVILRGDPLYWTRGQLKFGLKKTGKDTYQSLYLVGSRQPRQYNAVLKDSVLTIGRTNIFYRVRDTSANATGQKNFVLNDGLVFKELSDKTNYLRIPSFDLGIYGRIDSIIAANLEQIISKPGLIIDVRDNGGGGDRSYQALLPLVLDKKAMISPVSPSIFATPCILKYYSETRYEHCDNKDDSVSSDSTIALMERNIGKFTPAPSDTVTADTIYGFPKKVAIIANRWCASATEGFIINAIQSKKVTLYGENTWGMVAYGDWMKINLPCLPVYLSLPTKKMTIMGNADIESIGITPNVKLDPAHEEYWIKQVQEDMER